MNIKLLLGMMGISEADLRQSVETQVLPLLNGVNQEYKNVDERYSKLFADVLARLVDIDCKLDAISKCISNKDVREASTGSPDHEDLGQKFQRYIFEGHAAKSYPSALFNGEHHV